MGWMGLVGVSSALGGKGGVPPRGVRLGDIVSRRGGKGRRHTLRQSSQLISIVRQASEEKAPEAST